MAAGGRDFRGTLTLTSADGNGEARAGRAKRAAAQRAGWTTRFEAEDFLDSYDVDVDYLWTQQQGGGTFTTARGGLAAEAAPRRGGGGVPRPQEWVLCDMCRKWRHLPRGVSASSLPSSWVCDQATWRVTVPAGALPGQEAPARLRLCCILPEYDSSGENEVAPEPGAPMVSLTDDLQWVFAYDSADAALAKGSQPAAGVAQTQTHHLAGALPVPAAPQEQLPQPGHAAARPLDAAPRPAPVKQDGDAFA
jgi:hypothetical protein